MSLPAALALVPVTIRTFVDRAGTIMAGKRITATLDTEVSVGLTTIVPKRLTITLDADGKVPAGTTLPSTNDPDLNITGLAYTIEEKWPGGRKGLLTVPYDAAEVDLADLVDTVAPPSDTAAQSAAQAAAASATSASGSASTATTKAGEASASATAAASSASAAATSASAASASAGTATTQASAAGSSATAAAASATTATTKAGEASASAQAASDSADAAAATVGSLAASTGSSLVGFLQSGAGAVARTMQDKARETRSVADHDTLADAIASVGAGGGRLAVTPGTVSITTDTTLPANVALDVHKGAILDVASGVTLTVLGQINAGNQEIFDGAGTVNLDNSPNEYNLAWFKTTNGYINERFDFARRGMTSFRTKVIRVSKPYEGQAGVVASGGRLFWEFDAPLLIDDSANASTWYVEGEFSAAGDCDAFMQFDDSAKPENIYFYGPIQAAASATQTVTVGIDFRAASRISFFGQVVLNGFKTSVRVGGIEQTARVEDIYMPRTQFSYFTVAALDIYGKSTDTAQNIRVGNLRCTAAQTTGVPVARLRGQLRDITIDNIYYATDVAKNGYSANDAEDVVLIESNSDGTINHVGIGAIYQANATNGLRIQSANSNASGVVDVTVGRIYGKFNGSAANIDYCQRVRLLGIENSSDVTIGSNTGFADVRYAGAGLRTLTNNSTSSMINGLGRQNRGSGTPPAPSVAWPLGALIREDGDGRIYLRVAKAGVAADFVLVGGPPLATYSASNVTTDRTFDANAGALTASATYVQAEAQTVSNALAELADVVGTLIADLRARGAVL